MAQWSHEKFLKKVKAVIVGHAVADAVGVPYEFCLREDLDMAPATDLIGNGMYNMPEGCWSDDTSMTLCELDAMAAGDEEALDDNTMKNFCAWLYDDEFTPTGRTFDCGGTCSKAIDNYLRYMRSGKSGSAHFGETSEDSNGNGSLMRIDPYVLKNLDKSNKYGDKEPTAADISDYFDLIANGSKLTHAHPRSVLGCILYSGVLTGLLLRPEKQSVSFGLKSIRAALTVEGVCENRVYGYVKKELEELGTYDRLFDGVWKLSRNKISSSGYVVDTLEAAIWCLMNTDSYKECVLKAVNLGEDTDTVAAVAGGLAGALYGYDAIPEEWRAKLLRLDYIEELCEKAFPN